MGSLQQHANFSWSHHAIYLSLIIPFSMNAKSKISPILIIEVICLLFKTKFNAKFWCIINTQILTIILVLLFNYLNETKISKKCKITNRKNQNKEMNDDTIFVIFVATCSIFCSLFCSLLNSILFFIKYWHLSLFVIFTVLGFSSVNRYFSMKKMRE